MEKPESEFERRPESTHVILETGDCCFLCHQLVNPVGIVEEELETWRNLRGICGYLKVFGAKVILEAFKNFRLCEEKVARLQKNECLFWANLCRDCGQLLEHLEEMIIGGMKKAELVQLWRIMKGLRRLLGILGEGVNAESLKSEQIKDTEESRYVKVNQKVVDLLREELKMNCAGQVEFLDNVMSPRVFLSRCDIKETGEEINRGKSSRVSVSNIVKKEVVYENLSIFESNNEMESTPLPKRARSEPGRHSGRPQRRLSALAKKSCMTITKNKKYAKVVRCEVCQKNFQRQDILKRHQVLVHVEQSFLELKPASWTLQDFRLVCKRLLRDEIETATTDELTKCKLCNETYQTTYSMNTHMFSSHLEVLSDKLASWKGLESEPKTSSYVQTPVKCSYCNKVLTEAAKLSLHYVHVHPEQLYRSWKPRQQSLLDFKAFCLELWKELLSSCEENTDGSRKCLCCDLIFRNPRYLINHIVRKHKQFVIKEMRRKRKGASESQEECDEEKE